MCLAEVVQSSLDVVRSGPALKRSSLQAAQSSLKAVQCRSFFASEYWRTRQGQFKDLTTYNPSFSYKKRCEIISLIEMKYQ